MNKQLIRAQACIWTLAYTHLSPSFTAAVQVAKEQPWYGNGFSMEISMELLISSRHFRSLCGTVSAAPWSPDPLSPHIGQLSE